MRRFGDLEEDNVMMKISSMMILTLLVQNGRKLNRFGKMNQTARKVISPEDRGRTGAEVLRFRDLELCLFRWKKTLPSTTLIMRQQTRKLLKSLKKLKNRK